MNTKKTIKNLRGVEIPKSYPTQEEIEKLPTKKARVIVRDQMFEQEQIDFSVFERETVGNIIINSLSHYTVRDKREGFYCNAIAQSILQTETGRVELKDKLKVFLIAVLDDQTLRIEKDGAGKEITKGTYNGWAIAQVKEELGETINIKD
jgi:hypothetical protein